jgi:zinc protease
MRNSRGWVGLACLPLLYAVPAHAQTADEVIEKHLAATGGRAAHEKIESRISKGSVLVSVQGVEIGGPVEMYNKAPNKMRINFRMDLSQFGAGEVVVDQRFDGQSGYVSNSMQGDSQITGDQLQSMRNSTFPTPFLGYKQAGAKVELRGKEKAGDRDAFVIVYTPQEGPSSTHYFDAESFLILRTVSRMNIPEAGGELEQLTHFMDYRDVDGVKIPFAIRIENPAQTLMIKIDSVEHNKPIDDAVFVKPAQ